MLLDNYSASQASQNGVAEAPARPDDEFVSLLLSIAKRTRALFGLKLAEAGFHVGQDQLLLALEPDKPAVVSALADTLDVRPSTVSKMVDRLSEKGLVERLHDHSDERRTLIAITAAGLEAQVRLRRIWGDVRDEIAHSAGDALGGLVAEMRNLDRQLVSRLKRLR